MKGRWLKYVLSMLLGVIMACMASSCDVHEFPADLEPEPRREVILDFHLADLSHYTTIDLTPGARTRASDNAAHVRRHIIRIYNADDTRHRSPGTRGMVDAIEVTEREMKEMVSVPLHDLPPGDYTVAVWSEYMPDWKTCDYYHDTSDFQNITLLGGGTEDNYTHQGNTRYREAWSGTASITIGTDGSVLTRKTGQSVRIDMYRPMARYHFITTDLKEFLKSEINRRESQGLSDASAEAPDAPALDAPALNDYIVLVRYAGYMPYVYNLFTDKPVDSLTGVVYAGSIRQIDDNSAELAFDYVFVNGATTSTQVKLELYRREDRSLIASSDVINVPLIRDRYTLVKGNFLTATAGSSIGIHPDFDGQFNIEIR